MLGFSGKYEARSLFSFFIIFLISFTIKTLLDCDMHLKEITSVWEGCKGSNLLVFCCCCLYPVNLYSHKRAKTLKELVWVPGEIKRREVELDPQVI